MSSDHGAQWPLGKWNLLRRGHSRAADRRLARGGEAGHAHGRDGELGRSPADARRGGRRHAAADGDRRRPDRRPLVPGRAPRDAHRPPRPHLRDAYRRPRDERLPDPRGAGPRTGSTSAISIPSSSTPRTSIARRKRTRSATSDHGSGRRRRATRTRPRSFDAIASARRTSSTIWRAIRSSSATWLPIRRRRRASRRCGPIWTPGCATRGTRSPSSIRRFCSKRQPGDNDAVTLVALETLRPAVQPNVTLLRLRTDTGLVGIGEAFFAAGAVEAYLHDHVAPVLLGWDDPTPEAAAARLAPYVGFQGGGVETRALGAVDLALWDLLGRRAGLPVVDLLGGAVRESIPIYNTCAGSGYVGSSSRQESGNWGLDRATAYEDLRRLPASPGRARQGAPRRRHPRHEGVALRHRRREDRRHRHPAGRSRSRAGGGAGRSARRCRRCS